MSTELYGESHWDSPFVFTVFVALREKGIPFEERELDLSTGLHRTGDFAERSLTARVPTLVHDGFWISESLAVIEYLEDVAPEPRLLGKDAAERARCRQVLGWLRSDLTALRRDRPTTTMFGAPAKEPLTELGRKDAERLCEVATRFLGGRETLLPSWSIADADLAFMLHRLILNGDAVPAALERYARATWARPSVQAYVDHPRPKEA